MKFDRESKKTIISVKELSQYAYQRENPTFLTQKYGFIKKTISNYCTNIEGISSKNSSQNEVVRLAFTSSSYETNIPLEKNFVLGTHEILLNGHVDIISFDGVLHTVEEIKNVKYFPRDLSPFTDPSHFAQAVIYAYMFADTFGISEIKIRISYIKGESGDAVNFTSKFTKISLSRMVDSLISRAFPLINAFAENNTALLDECIKFPFPYKSIRGSQAELIKSAFHTMKNGGSLMVSAPTGIGKTVSTLFPALKAVGNSFSDKIFYFTAKTVTGRAAMETARHLAKYIPHLRGIMICSKDQMCPYKKQNRNLDLHSACRRCDRIDSIFDISSNKAISYSERQLSALCELISSDDKIYTVERIIKTAEKYSLCPTELSLDLSEYCTVIVCDYNYILDDRIKFRRYFKSIDRCEEYIFLFDEAHNIPDRARATYSCSISNNQISSLFEYYSEIIHDNPQLRDGIYELERGLCDIKTLCTDSEHVKSSSAGDIVCGYYEAHGIPSSLLKSLEALYSILNKLLRNEQDLYYFLSPLHTTVSEFLFCAGFFDNKFSMFCERCGDAVTVNLLCIDPSDIIRQALTAAKSTVMFSATLSPIDYYKDVLGLDNAKTLELSSPYEKDNLCLIAYDSISTRLSDRKQTAYECAEVIAEAITVKNGKYIVYFPSYEYMKSVCRIFANIMPDYSIVMQRSDMSHSEKWRFINVFLNHAEENIIGFCVLGGIFSEGIDLIGDSLIGTIIVGTGMPQISAERNIMASYYDNKNEMGHEFAYSYSGMNKVLQAAGRVIRSENDKGVVILIDDRYKEPGIKMMFPPHWRHLKYTGDINSMRSILDDFWSRD